MNDLQPRPRGRPSTRQGTGSKKTSIWIDAATTAALLRLGDGSLIGGIREAVRVAQLAQDDGR